MTVFMTFRLADSLPKAVLEAYGKERDRLDRLIALYPDEEALHRERAKLFGDRIDRALDSGHGRCAFRNPELAGQMMAILKNRDGTDYLLHSAVVMPNHVHLVATLSPEASLKRVTHAWKSTSAHLAVKHFGASRPFWQSESYDHIVRHTDALRAVNRYVVENPVKAKLGDWPWVYLADLSLED